jgi:hypothetical protein
LRRVGVKMKLVLAMMLACAVACGGPPRGANSGTEPDLRDLFWTDVEAILAQRDVAIDDAGRRQLAEITDRGAERMAGKPPEQVDEARRQLRGLVESAIGEAATHHAVNGKGALELRKLDLTAITSKLCPVFPFC